jgi:Insect cuticle protein.
VLLIAAVAVADNPPRYESNEYPDAAPVYNFRYEVDNNEHYEPQQFNQEEDRNGYETHGQYSVLLPDGRTQTVTYQVNGDSGFVADVAYEGEAKYEPYQPKKPAPPKYEPAPTYAPKPAPTYPPPPPPKYEPAPTYAPKPAPTYPPPPPPAYKPAPTYPPKPEPTDAPKREYGPVKFNPFG